MEKRSTGNVSSVDFRLKLERRMLSVGGLCFVPKAAKQISKKSKLDSINAYNMNKSLVGVHNLTGMEITKGLRTKDHQI